MTLGVPMAPSKMYSWPNKDDYFLRSWDRHSNHGGEFTSRESRPKSKGW